jgi:hypothetical protein
MLLLEAAPAEHRGICHGRNCPSPSPSSSPEPSGRMLGAAVGDSYPFSGRVANTQDIEGRLGRTFPIMRRYYSVGASLPTAEDQTLRDGGRQFTFNITAGDNHTWASICNGSADAWLRGRAPVLKAFQPVTYISFQSEFTRYANAGTPQYEGTPAEYRCASKRVHDVLTAEGVNLVLQWSPMAANWTSSNPWYGRMDEFWGEWNDRVSPDGYDWNANRSFASIFSAVRSYAVSKGRAFEVLETGTPNDAGVTYKVNWYAGMAETCVAWDCRMVIYFHHGPQDGFKETWWIDGLPTDPVPDLVQAYRAAMVRMAGG